MRWLLTIAVASACWPAAAQPAAQANDTVQFRDADGNVVTRIGELRQSPEGLMIVSAGTRTAISPADVISVYYSQLAGVDDRTRMAFTEWDAKPNAESLARYIEVQRSLGGAADDRTRRVIAFKVAMTTAAVADSGDAANTELVAVERLASFVREYADSWEVWPAGIAAMRLLGELGKHSDAAAIAAILARAAGVPAPLKIESRLLEAELLFRGKSFLTSASALDAAEKAGNLNTAQAERLALLRAALTAGEDRARLPAAVQQIRAAIDRSTSDAFPATAHRVLGELFLMADKPADARWEFLWIEAVHNRNPDDVRHALDRLADVFELLGDSDRAAAYRDKHKKARGG